MLPQAMSSTPVESVISIVTPDYVSEHVPTVVRVSGFESGWVIGYVSERTNTHVTFRQQTAHCG